MSTPLRELTPVTPATLPGEERALDFFFNHAAYRLAGFFEASFWTGISLQLSLSEPAIRQALAAIGSLYEQEASPSRRSTTLKQSNVHPTLSLHLYNKSIQSVIQKTRDPTATPIVVMATILFASYEFLRADATAASTHITNGVNLLQRWRDHNGEHSKGLAWPQRYSSFQSHFMETELAPILSLFSVNSSQFAPGPHRRIVLNGVDDRGLVFIASEFRNIREARVAFTDLVTANVGIFERIESGLKKGELPTADSLAVFRDMQSCIHRWKINFEALCQEHQQVWDAKDMNAAIALRIMWHSAILGIRSYLVQEESDWDAYRADYEELVQLAECLLARPADNHDIFANALSVDFGLIFPLHGAAWKCRWPDLRRRGLHLLTRVSKREWLLDADQYDTIFTRIMELEEASLGVTRGISQQANVLVPEYARIHDFYCEAVPYSAQWGHQVAITFVSKPQGPDGPWHFMTERIPVGVSSSGGVVLPSNLISCKSWETPRATDPEKWMALKSLMFGGRLEGE
ncbi:hypothetical protein FE257_005936 [Aspergillus nanangensis]|uniref:C6 zinc finger domain protein n=1 Tax=Aspergillus nanangensis TaxID=2582783 RepID=A0AAD4GV90_ASPNN|nr:hypothetical protein FE257_005936 [Aspergillus nanangensis]